MSDEKSNVVSMYDAKFALKRKKAAVRSKKSRDDKLKAALEKHGSDKGTAIRDRFKHQKIDLIPLVEPKDTEE